MDNQELNLLRDHAEGRPLRTATEQSLEVLMDSGIVEQSNASQETVLPGAAEIVRPQTSVIVS